MPGPQPIRILCYHPPLSTHPAFQVLLEILRSGSGIRVKLEPCEVAGTAGSAHGTRVAPPDAAAFTPDLAIQCLAPAAEAEAAAAPVARRSDVPVVAAFDGYGAQQIEQIVRDRFDDFVTSPFRDQDVWPRLVRQTQVVPGDDRALLEQLQNRLGTRHLLGRSPALLAQLERIPPIARTDLTVLITGETGTGKELCARAVHVLSRRIECPFVPVNCATLPAGLVESELYGHERGAYTGAVASRKGLVRQAEGGTLFLDEVESLDARAQAALLRFLQEREIRPVGGDAVARADVRIVAAANVDLATTVANGAFRRDLFFRLSETRLTMPPLRERGEDIAILADHFIRKHAPELGSPVRGMSTEVLRQLRTYDWPGNVRELENTLREALLFAGHHLLRPSDVSLPRLAAEAEPLTFRGLKARVVAEFERDFVARQLAQHNGNLTQAARACGKHPRAFRELVRRYGF